MAEKAGEVAALLKTLSHPERLLIVCTLARSEASVGDLERELDIHQPTLSRQLGVIRDAGLVETRRDAKQIFYRLSQTKAAQVVEALYRIFCA